MGFLTKALSTGAKIIKAVTPTKAKLTNVKDTLISAVTGKGVTANTGSKTVDKVLSSAASNPFTTALAATAIVAPVKTIAAVKSTSAALPTKAKVAAVIAAPVIASAVIQNPKIISSVAKTPAALSSFGANIGNLSANPSLENLEKTIKDNPIISGAVIGAGALIVGKGVTGIGASVANTIATSKNTAAAKAAAQGISIPMSDLQAGDNLIPQSANNALVPAVYGSSVGAATVPYTPQTQVLGRPAGASALSRRRRLAQNKRPSQSQSLRVNIYNQTKSLYRSHTMYN